MQNGHVLAKRIKKWRSLDAEGLDLLLGVPHLDLTADILATRQRELREGDANALEELGDLVGLPGLRVNDLRSHIFSPPQEPLQLRTRAGLHMQAVNSVGSSHPHSKPLRLCLVAEGRQVNCVCLGMVGIEPASQLCSLVDRYGCSPM